MQVVIDIPDIFVEWAKDEMSVEIFDNRSMADAMSSAIRNGIVLPKGHGRLIDADRLVKKAYKEGLPFVECAQEFSMMLEINAPTVIPADTEGE